MTTAREAAMLALKPKRSVTLARTLTTWPMALTTSTSPIAQTPYLYHLAHGPYPTTHGAVS